MTTRRSGCFSLIRLSACAEHRQHAPRFASPAAGQHARRGASGRDAVARPERGTVAALSAGLDGGMADKGAGDAVFGEEGHLEGQQRHQMIDALGELAGAARPPGPKLRRDVMDDRDAGTVEIDGRA